MMSYHLDREEEDQRKDEDTQGEIVDIMHLFLGGCEKTMHRFRILAPKICCGMVFNIGHGLVLRYFLPMPGRHLLYCDLSINDRRSIKLSRHSQMGGDSMRRDRFLEGESARINRGHSENKNNEEGDHVVSSKEESNLNYFMATGCSLFAYFFLVVTL